MIFRATEIILSFHCDEYASMFVKTISPKRCTCVTYPVVYYLIFVDRPVFSRVGRTGGVFGVPK